MGAQPDVAGTLDPMGTTTPARREPELYAGKDGYITTWIQLANEIAVLDPAATAPILEGLVVLRRPRSSAADKLIDVFASNGELARQSGRQLVDLCDQVSTSEHVNRAFRVTLEAHPANDAEFNAWAAAQLRADWGHCGLRVRSATLELFLDRVGINDDTDRVRLHPAATPAMVAAYVADSAPDERGQRVLVATAHRSCPAELLQAVWDELPDDLRLKGNAAFRLSRHENTPPEVLDQMKTSRASRVLYGIASNPNTSTPTLLELARRGPSEYQQTAAARPEVRAFLGASR